MRLVLVTPAWRRYDVTRVCLAQRAHLAGVLAGRGIEVSVLVVADDCNLDIASGYGFDTLERPNDELGRKWNDGLEHACRTMDADYVAVVGSDDWIHPDLFDRLPLHEVPWEDPTPEQPFVIWSPNTPEAITGRELALIDLSRGRMRRCRSRGPYGVIPWVLPRTALEPSRYRPVRDHLNIGLDGSLAAGLGVRPEWVFHDPHDLARVDFKSDVNLNSFDKIADAIGYGPVEPDPWPLLETRYPADLVALARNLSLAVAA